MKTEAPRRSSSVAEVSTGVRCATPCRRAAAPRTSSTVMGRSAPISPLSTAWGSGGAAALARVLHEPADRHRGEVLLVQALHQLAQQGLQRLGVGDAELHHLARAQRA